MSRLIWICLPLLLAGLDLWMVYRKRMRWQYITKPAVVTSLLIWLISLPIPLLDNRFFLAAIILCLVGDIFLMMPGSNFLIGLGSFLFAHITFIAYFRVWEGAFPTWIILFMILIAIAAFIYGRLVWMKMVEKRGARRLRLLVILYCVALTIMLISTAATLTQDSWPGNAAVITFLGGGLFFVSDCLLGYDRFVKPFANARLLIRLSYYLAQILLCSAVVLRSA